MQTVIIRFEDVTIDTDAQEVWRDDERLDVQPQVFDVLVHLVLNRERVVSKTELLDAVWNHRFVTESALTSRIKSARRLIGDNGRDQRLIRTVHGRGYRFIGSVIDEPERAQVPRATELPAGGRARTRLPAPSTRFVGREHEIGAVRRLLENPGCRLVTITAPGGMGKTRLALAVAEQFVEEDETDVGFVPLAAITDADRLVHAIASTLGVPVVPGVPPATQLLAHLADTSLLLVLDNLEQLPNVDLIADIIETAPGVTVLATSRGRLGLQGEWLFELTGLGWSPPDAESEDAERDAIELFIEAASRVRPDVVVDEGTASAVRRICRSVGGMPLAVELAAGWCGVLSVDEIADELERDLDVLATELRDVPERHRSVRAVFDASWAQLDPGEQEALMALSVFRGGFTRSAAEAVAGIDVSTLRRLQAASMLPAAAGGRHVPHELLRQYGEERLTESGREEAVRRAHREFHLSWMAEQAPRVRGTGRRDAIDAIDADLDNVRIAWLEAVAAADAQAVATGLIDLWTFFDARDHLDELGSLIRTARDRWPTVEPGDAASATVSAAQGLIAVCEGQIVAQRGALEPGYILVGHGLDRVRESQASGALVAYAHLWGGWVAFLLARNTDAASLAATAQSSFRTLDDRWGEARCQHLIGNNETALGHLAAAEPVLQECHATMTQLGDRRGIALASRNLAILAGWVGDHARAGQLLEIVLEIGDEIDDRLMQALALREIGKIQTAEGELEQAIDTLRHSIEITDRVQLSWESAATHDDLGNALAALGDLDAAASALDACSRAAAEQRNRYYAARCEGDVGALALRRGDPRAAHDHLVRAHEAWEEIGHEPYLAWVELQLGHTAAALDDGVEMVERYRRAVELSVRHGLAPFALDAMLGAVRHAVITPPAERRRLVDLIAAHPAANSETRELAMAAREGDPPPRPVDADWRRAAARVVERLGGPSATGGGPPSQSAG